MSEKINLSFPRVRNEDGTYDSMCTKCFTPVGRKKEPSELEEMEDSHVCKPGEARFHPADGEFL